MRLSLRPARPGGGHHRLCPHPRALMEPATRRVPPPPGKASRVGVRRSHAEGKSRAGSSWEVVFRGGGGGGRHRTGQREGAWALRGCGHGSGSRGRAGHGAPTRVAGGISQRWISSRGGGGSPDRPPQGFKEGKIILRERSAGARRWLRADGSGTSKVISSSNIAFLTHMVKSAWRQLGEVPVVTSV